MRAHFEALLLGVIVAASDFTCNIFLSSGLEKMLGKWLMLRRPLYSVFQNSLAVRFLDVSEVTCSCERFREGGKKVAPNSNSVGTDFRDLQPNQLI